MKLRLLNLFIDALPGQMQITHAGCLFNVLTQDVIGRLLLNGIGYESESIRHLAETLSSGGVFVDVGANIGLYSIIVSRNPAVKVIAFEPNPIAFALLQRNIRANRRNNVVAICAGVSNEAKLMPLETMEYRNIGSTKLASMPSATAAQGPRSISLHPVIHFGQCISTFCLPSIDALKIDVEGHEPAVLAAIDWEAPSRPKQILIEFKAQQSGIPDSRRESWKCLADAGYQAFDIRGNRVSKLNLDQSYPDDNLVFRDAENGAG